MFTILLCTYLGTMHGYILSGSMTSIWERLLRFHGFYSCSLSSFWVLELRSVCSQYPFHFATKNSKHSLRSWDFHVVFLLLYFYFIKESLNETVFFMIEGRSLYSNIVSWAPIGYWNVFNFSILCRKDWFCINTTLS